METMRPIRADHRAVCECECVEMTNQQSAKMKRTDDKRNAGVGTEKECFEMERSEVCNGHSERRQIVTRRARVPPPRFTVGIRGSGISAGDSSQHFENKRNILFNMIPFYCTC